MKETILFYHKNCPDGFGAAYAFWKKFGNSIEYYPLSHNDDLPEIDGKNVFFADIALSREKTLEVEKRAESIFIIDHHISKYDELKDLHYYHFNNNKSGAVLSWDYLFYTPAPKILKLVQDRDIWKWEIENSEKLLLVLDSLKYSFEEWDSFNTNLKKDLDSILSQGDAILRSNDRVIEKIEKNVFKMEIRGVKVPVVNTPIFRSKLLMNLCIDQPFAAGYHYDGKDYIFSLRSLPSGMDVSKIAASFAGGGGHKNAAGFSVKNLEELNE